MRAEKKRPDSAALLTPDIIKMSNATSNNSQGWGNTSTSGGWGNSGNGWGHRKVESPPPPKDTVLDLKSFFALSDEKKREYFLPDNMECTVIKERLIPHDQSGQHCGKFTDELYKHLRKKFLDGAEEIKTINRRHAKKEDLARSFLIAPVHYGIKVKGIANPVYSCCFNRESKFGKIVFPNDGKRNSIFDEKQCGIYNTFDEYLQHLHERNDMYHSSVLEFLTNRYSYITEIINFSENNPEREKINYSLDDFSKLIKVRQKQYLLPRIKDVHVKKNSK